MAYAKFWHLVTQMKEWRGRETCVTKPGEMSLETNMPGLIPTTQYLYITKLFIMFVYRYTV